MRLAIAGLITLALLTIPSLVRAETTQTVFYVSTTGNTGRVNYDIRLNGDCSPVSSNPVHTYWKKADGSTREMNPLERQGYGITSQTVSGNQVSFTISAFQSHGIEKPITVTSSRATNGGCQTRAVTSINGTATQMSHARVEVDRTNVVGLTVGLRIRNITLVGAGQQSETIVCRSNCTYGI